MGEIYDVLEDVKNSVTGVKEETNQLDTRVTELESTNLQLQKELTDMKQKLLYIENLSRIKEQEKWNMGWMWKLDFENIERENWY